MKKFFRSNSTALIATIALLVATNTLKAQEEEKPKVMEIYGFIMMDAGYNFNQIHPDWFDVVRPTKLPSFKNEFGTDGNTYFSVRQTRLGFKNYFQTGLGELKTHFEFEMFGTGVDAGQTTMRLRHAYAELGKWGVGQYWSPFMDIDVFPNTVEYWGPTGMAFFRNVQIRYMPIQGDSRLTFALERPGASADQGVYQNRIELQNVRSRFNLPDLSAEFRYGKKWGYVEIAGILRKIQWVDEAINPQYDLSDEVIGWGINLSTNLKIGDRTTFRGQFVYGEGIENYMNDATTDVGIKTNPGNPTKPIEGVALPLTGIVAFIDHNWNEKFSTSVGYSSIDIDNANGSAPDAFATGQYGIANLLYTPFKNFMCGVELQYGKRENFTDGFESDIFKTQLSFKYSFGHAFYANK